MLEESKMLNQVESAVDVITVYNTVPYFIIEEELEELNREEYQNISTKRRGGKEVSFCARSC